VTTSPRSWPRRAFPAFLALGFLAAGTAVLPAPAPSTTTPDEHAVGFVCLNGVAMSVWAAAYFNQLAEARGLRERAFARASIPSYEAVPMRMRLALALDGLRAGSYTPSLIDRADTRAAGRIVLIDTQLPEGIAGDTARIESWDGFPPMRERYWRARAALKQRVEALVDELAASEVPLR
jgi:hypothetical protein